MNGEQKSRASKLVKKLAAALAVGLIYLIFVRITGRRIPCVFYELSGKYCPGCGITRMFVALSRLDLAAAADYNLLALILLLPLFPGFGPCLLAGFLVALMGVWLFASYRIRFHVALDDPCYGAACAWAEILFLLAWLAVVRLL